MLACRSDMLIPDFFQVSKFTKEAYGTSPCPKKYLPYLWMYRFNIKTGHVTDGPVANGKVSGEFPTINPAYSMVKTQFLYLAMVDGLGWGIQMNGVAKFDLEKDTTITWNAGEKTYCGEPVFVASKQEGKEDDGYLVTFCHCESSSASFLVILDARSLQVVAKIHTHYRIPYGFHGIWVKKADVAYQSGLKRKLVNEKEYLAGLTLWKRLWLKTVQLLGN